jgi:hypothetical protein
MQQEGQKIYTYEDLKSFLNSLTNEQLQRSVKVLIEGQPIQLVYHANVNENELRNPSGELWEERSVYESFEDNEAGIWDESETKLEAGEVVLFADTLGCV